MKESMVNKLIEGRPIEVRNLIWKGQAVPGYTISNRGDVYRYGKLRSTWLVNDRNYAVVVIDDHRWQYRVDYMVAYTFLGMYDDAIRLIHLNDDITDDRLDNLRWYRKSDVIESYKDLAIIEEDGTIVEEWRPCLTEHNPDLAYEVSNFGMIRDVDHELLPLHDSHGYRVFYYLDGKYAKQTRVKPVHRAVAEAFIPNPHNYELVNHLDGNGYNDVVNNLEWATSGMNMEHAYLQKLNTNTKYTVPQIRSVCQLLSSRKITAVQISHMTGVDRKTISDIYRGRRWNDISREYSFEPRKWNDTIKAEVRAQIANGKNCREICSLLNLEFNQSTISFYERMRRELKAQGKIK